MAEKGKKGGSSAIQRGKSINKTSKTPIEKKKARSDVIDDLFQKAKEKKKIDREEKQKKEEKKIIDKEKKKEALEILTGVTAEDKKRRETEEGYKIYSFDELKLGRGGDTPLCPFDCDCCF
ncbi:Protein of unknown function DUF1764 eukaryotic [Carpediemonas membranifera]|uniref:Uncharacterized protein n=1 Tax=Carpediemonas membranifera TaxID=201153 RepID=A0A8J6AZF5_9EUKA|nr:Protein of unknown function DUF1764 eukaryotic [Carpediemonas membranifera]|eukprot:KAG9392148.1 Protein of unknown function DUF1764 eukaryotic [Carpediemonas membranifera]